MASCQKTQKANPRGGCLVHGPNFEAPLPQVALDMVQIHYSKSKLRFYLVHWISYGIGLLDSIVIICREHNGSKVSSDSQTR